MGIIVFSLFECWIWIALPRSLLIYFYFYLSQNYLCINSNSIASRSVQRWHQHRDNLHRSDGREPRNEKRHEAFYKVSIEWHLCFALTSSPTTELFHDPLGPSRAFDVRPLNSCACRVLVTMQISPPETNEMVIFLSRVSLIRFGVGACRRLARKLMPEKC